MTVIEIKVPDIGDYSKVPVIEVLVTVGDHVVKNQGILTLESDKATLEVPSMNNGVVKELKVNVGDLLSQGDVILLLETEDTTAPPSPSNTATSDTTSPPTSRFQADSPRSTTRRHHVPHGRTRCRSRRLHRSIPRR
ncbi:hypothetical protein B375_0209860 [Xylella fastidiosa 6c]|nr:hypothetical protein B375_0209860 [Xylella fastidiosa 6c]